MASIDRRAFLAGAAAAGMMPGSSSAQSYPSSSPEMTWLIFQAPGGSVDLTTRLIEPYVEKAGFRVRLEYAQGAGGRIARTKLFNAKPDGFSLMTDVAPAAIVDQTLYKVPYTVDSFEPVYGWILNGFQYCVKKGSPIKTFGDFVAETKRRRVTVGTIGRGGAFHMHVAGMRAQLGLKFDVVHFDGAAPAYHAVIGGHIDVAGGGAGSGSRQSNALQFIGMTGNGREKALSDVPTIVEQGFNVTPIEQLYFANTSPGVPADRLAILTKTFAEAFATQELVAKLEGSGDFLTLVPPERIKEIHKSHKALVASVADEMKK